MINDPGKHQVNGTALAVSLRAGLWRSRRRAVTGGADESLAEQIGDIDGVEIYGCVVAPCAGSLSRVRGRRLLGRPCACDAVRRA